jgi:hypothetical protein
MKKLCRSVRKFIRQEKARIRRELLSLNEQEEKITQLYQRFIKKEEKKEEKVQPVEFVKSDVKLKIEKPSRVKN